MVIIEIATLSMTSLIPDLEIPQTLGARLANLVTRVRACLAAACNPHDAFSMTILATVFFWCVLSSFEVITVVTLMFGVRSQLYSKLYDLSHL